VWQSAELSAEMESSVLETFTDRARFFDATATAPNVHPAESVQLRDKPTLVDSIPH
jgi:hypothetical protein